MIASRIFVALNCIRLDNINQMMNPIDSTGTIAPNHTCELFAKTYFSRIKEAIEPITKIVPNIITPPVINSAINMITQFIF